mgnify:CR=1 FL=1
MDCKQQILNTIPNNTCCSQALLNVVILSAQTNKDKTNLIINAQPSLLEKVTKIVASFYPNIEINSWDGFFFFLEVDCLLCGQYPNDRIVRELLSLLLELYSKQVHHNRNGISMVQIRSDLSEREI